MPIILSIETSNTNCSVCISENGNMVALRENNEGNQHANILTPFIEDVLAEANITVRQLDALCLSAGPGSYTGLRIGASAAKAICYATGKPLIAVGTLQAMVAGYIAAQGLPDNNIVFCPMIDARRMEVYAALYDGQLKELKAPEPWILTERSFFGEYLSTKKVICLGNGAGKATGVLANDKVIIDAEPYLSALNLIKIAENKLLNNQYEELAYFEPVYLKSTPMKQ